MTRKADIFAIVILVITTHQSLTESCEAYKFVKTKGMELANHVIKITTRSLVELCWGECVALPRCFSINVRESCGVYECDLNNSTKNATGGLVPREGSEYHEMGDVDAANCKKHDCISKQIPSNDWYRIGAWVYKLFKDEKNWDDALEYCKSIGGNLVSLSTAIRDSFVYNVLAKPWLTNMTVPPLGKYYLALDGHDKEVSLQTEEHSNQAHYRNYGGETSLFVTKDGSSYAEIPAFHFNPEGFTLAFKTNVRTIGAGKLGTILSDIPSLGNEGFTLKYEEEDKQIHFNILNIDSTSFLHMKTLLSEHVPQFKWIHIALTWNRTTNKVEIAVDGKYVQSKISNQDSNSEIKKTGTKMYKIGLPSQIDSNIDPFHGYLKQLMVFDRALGLEEINAVMNYTEHGPWIGLSDCTASKLFGWSDGTPIAQYMPLPAYNDPTNGPAANSSCVAMGKNGKWMNKICSEKRPFICQKPLEP